jgi:hypothetical protein
MVSKLSSEVQQLRIDNETLKTQLRDLQQVPSHVPSARRDAASCAIASYRDVVCSVSGNPETAVVIAPARNSLPARSIVSGDIPSDGVGKKPITPSPVGTAAVNNTTKNPGLP